MDRFRLKPTSLPHTSFVAGLQSERIEEVLCNYEAAIANFRKVVTGLQKQEDDDCLSETRFGCSVDLARTLLRHSADNEAEAFAIFQEELDLCVDPLYREMPLFKSSTWHDAISGTRNNG